MTWLGSDLSGAFDRFQYCLCFIQAFLIFGFRDGVGDDAGAGLDVTFDTLRDRGRNH